MHVIIDFFLNYPIASIIIALITIAFIIGYILAVRDDPISIPFTGKIFFVYLLVIVFVLLFTNDKKSISTYDNVQTFRHENDYDYIDLDDYIPYDYDGDYENFTEEDMIDAYQQGIKDGIEQTIEYYDSLDD